MDSKFSKNASFLKKIFPFLLVALGNVWIWRVLTENFLIAIVLLFCSWLFLKSIRLGRFYKFTLVLLVILMAFQLSKTEGRSLTYLTEGEKVIQLQRLNEYQPVGFDIGGKTFWIPLAHWLEQRPETLALYRIQSNLKDVLNPNLYFFANHPNERVGVKENEKFPYILLPFFVLGLLSLDFGKNRTILSLFFFAPILLIALAGTYFDVEPVSLFPFIAISSALGIEYAWNKVSRFIPTRFRGMAIGIFFAFYVIVFVQSWLYDKS